MEMTEEDVVKYLLDRAEGEAAETVRNIIDDLNDIQCDSRLSDNFETALAALIEHHGADALTALAAVMRHYEIGITCQHEDGSWVADEDIVIVQDDESGNVSKIFVCEDSIVWAESLTANDIKPER